jgi:P27 family predicted phage terminase small subunit
MEAVTQGRKKVPRSVKLKQGTLNVTRDNPNELQLPPIDGVPSPPQQLNFCDDERYNSLARELWKQTTETLFNQGLLASVHLADIIAYCVEHATYFLALDKIKEKGYTLIAQSGYEYANPYVALRNTARKNVQDIAARYGLTPVDAAKISAKQQEAKDDMFI